MTPAQRTMAARDAALTRWAHEPDTVAATAPARKGWYARFERQVDPDGILDPDDRAIRADRLMRAHMSKMARRSSEARQAAKARRST